MPTIDTSTLTPDARRNYEHTPFEVMQIYCGLDSCLTYEIHGTLRGLYGESAIYDFERAIQAPYLEIMLRGFKIDELGRRFAVRELSAKRQQLSEVLDEFAQAVWGKSLNPRSPKQLQEFFYSKMHLPEIMISQKGVRKLSMNREVLEKLDAYLYARPFVNLILGIRELSKQIEVFETEIDADGRFRASYNIAGTETGRPSSSENAFGTGGNAQNIAPPLRYVFVSDPGWKLCVIDLEQVEARDVGFFCGNLFGDWRFLDACEGGDLHTSNARLIWPERSWTGDIKKDRELAGAIFYRDFSFRDMAKRGSHLSNYMGTAWTAARALKVPQQIMEDFQHRYCRGSAAAYPSIARWWQWTAEQLQTTHQIVTPFGRRRHFFGRPGDDTTLREAIAFLPQSTTADRMNLGLWRVWKKMPQVQLLAQTYDSITFQYREAGSAAEARVIEEALELIKVELVANNGRRYVVPGEAKVGWNWGNYADEGDVKKALAAGKNPPRVNKEGLKKWSPKAPDERQRLVGLQRVGF